MGKVSQLCGGEIYEPSTHFCVESVYSKSKFELCGKRIIRRKTHFCFNNVVYKNVDTKTAVRNPLWENFEQYHIPSLALTKIPESQKSSFFTLTPTTRTSLISNSWIPTGSYQTIKTSIANDRNNLEKPIQLLQHRKVINSLYNPAKSEFENLNNGKNRAVMSMFGEEHGEKKDILPTHLKCGAFHYNSMTHFCFKNQVSQRCGALAFNADVLFCFNGFLYSQKVYEKCGENLFNKLTNLCYNGKVYENSSNGEKNLT